MPERDQVLIAGCGAITAVGAGIDCLRKALRSNTSGLRSLERFDHPRFQSSVVGAAPVIEERDDDPAFRLASCAVEEALSQSNPVKEGFCAPDRLATVLSTTKANIEALERLADRRPCSESAWRHLQPDLLAADLAKKFVASGPVQCVSAACASGLVALQQGAKLIQRGEADAALVLGVDHLSAFVLAGFSALKALDPTGCRPFDRDRCGLSPGEAGAAIVLVRATKEAKLAEPKRIALAGWGGSNDANHLTGPSRDGSGLALAIRRALDSAGLDASAIDYVNAHGTGTAYNDATEVLALKTIFGENSPPVSGSKGMLGHTLGAAGIVETIVCWLAMQEGLVPGTPRLKQPADGAPARLAREPVFDVKLKAVLKLNTGFGGINGALVLRSISDGN